MVKAKPQKPVEAAARVATAAKPFKAAAAPLKPSPSAVQVMTPAGTKLLATSKPSAKAAKVIGATAVATTQKPAKAEKAEKADKADKSKKPKLVRDSFTIPKAEYTVLDSLKERAARGGCPARKSELLRAGIKVLAGMDDASFLAAMKQVPTIKTGRPAKG